MRLAISDRKCT